MSTDQGADEMRIRHLLHSQGVGPGPASASAPRQRDWLDDLWDQQEEQPKPKAVVPTRVIPAGAPLPDRGPLPGEVPPWRPAPPAPPAPPVAQQPDPVPHPVQVYVTVQPPYYEPDPEPGPTWKDRLGAAGAWFGKPWQAVGALVLAVIPIPWTGYSAGTTWAYTVSQARQVGMPYGYALAFGAFGLVVLRITRRGATLLRLWLLAVTFVGLFGAMNWYDPITFLTGVSR